jgi:hypothetical protein
VLATATACVALAVMLQPLRARFDDDRVPSRRFRLSDFRVTIASVLKSPDLRGLSFALWVGISLLRQRAPMEAVIGSGTIRPTRG